MERQPFRSKSMSKEVSQCDEADIVDKSSRADMLPIPATEAGVPSGPASTTTSAPDFALFDNNFDLNSQPANYFRQRSSLEKLVFQASRESTEKLDPQYSIRLASKFPKLVGRVDVISASRNVKSLLKMPYSPGSHVSIMVHRVGDSLLLDEFDLFAFMLRQDFENWEWLRHFAASNNMAVRPTGFKRDDVSSKRLMTKFLYHTASISGEASLTTKTVHTQQPQPPSPRPASSAASAEPSPSGLEDPLKCMVWNFENLRMLLGTNLPIFGGPKHPCISVRLRDSAKPISVLTGIDYWLDNMINDVPELAMCYHSNGLFKGFDIYSTEHIPRMADFDPDSVLEIARSLVWFLKANATKEGHTYWLFKAPNSDIVKLYDLTSLCQEPGSDGGGGPSPQSPSSEASSSASDSNNPFATPVGMLCYRVARSCFDNTETRGRLSVRERGRLRRLLACSLQLLNQSAQHRGVLASCNLLLSELLLMDEQKERLETQKQRQQQQRQQQQQQQALQKLSKRPHHHAHRRPHRQLLVASNAVTSMDLRQLMDSLAVAATAAASGSSAAGASASRASSQRTNDVTDDVEEASESVAETEEQTSPEEADFEDPVEDEDSNADEPDALSPLTRAEASLRHAVAAVRLLPGLADTAMSSASELLTDLDSIPMAKSNVAIPLPSSSTVAVTPSPASSHSSELVAALTVVAKSCLQVVEALAAEGESKDKKIDAGESSRDSLLLNCYRVAAAAIGLASALTGPAAKSPELTALEIQVVEQSADAMMQAYRSDKPSPADASDTSVALSAASSDTVDSRLIQIFLEAIHLIEEHLQFVGDVKLPIGRVYVTLTNWLDNQSAPNADCLDEIVWLYRWLCDKSTLTSGSSASRRQRLHRLRDSLAGAVNEWALRTLVEVKHAMADTEVGEPLRDSLQLEKRLESALDALKQVQQQQQQQSGQQATEDAVYLLANQALLLRALNECRHSRVRRAQARQREQAAAAGSSHQPPTVSWAEIQLHDSAMQTYQAALDRLGPRQHLAAKGSFAALWDNLAWQRLMTMMDKIEAVTTAQVEGFSEEERCKEALRLCRQALAMCDTESPSDRRNSFRYQAAQAHKNIADMLLRAYFEGWSKAKSLADCRSKWMLGYSGCIRLLLSIRSDPQLRNPRMCLESVGKLAKFQMDRADEARKQAAATGEILLPGRRYRQESALLRMLAVARHPLEELLMAASNSDIDQADLPGISSLIRVVSNEALDAVRGLMQLAKILKDQSKLESVKALYAQLLRLLAVATAQDNGQAVESILASARHAFCVLSDWCSENAAAVKSGFSPDTEDADFEDFVEPPVAPLSVKEAKQAAGDF